MLKRSNPPFFKPNPDVKIPAETFQDGIDFVPTKKEIIFGHHFTSIAGLGPIVGPANLPESIKVPYAIAITIIGIFIVLFADTLDTAVRIQRYIISDFKKPLT